MGYKSELACKTPEGCRMLQMDTDHLLMTTVRALTPDVITAQREQITAKIEEDCVDHAVLLDGQAEYPRFHFTDQPSTGKCARYIQRILDTTGEQGFHNA